MTIHGSNILGAELSAAGTSTFYGHDPRKGVALQPAFHEASLEEIDRALTLAQEAAPQLQALGAEAVATFLLAIAEEIVALGDSLVAKADEESALGVDRLKGERDRTVNQIKMFANLVTEGSWVDARIDTALPDRKPLPRPDLRRMLQPLGPVAVFGASNFPLAFSVAGGDTVSAFAARNPVVVKAHPAHPGTSELVAGAITRACEKAGWPKGAFALLHGVMPDTSLALVKHSKTKAVAFTGSLRAGRALFDAAAARPEPIPAFCEMGSVNPVFILPGALATNAEALAEKLFRSVTLGVGQFCTCPGLVFVIDDAGSQKFIATLEQHFSGAAPGTMLNAGIANGYKQALGRTRTDGVEHHAAAAIGDGPHTAGYPALLETDSATWLRNTDLHQEIFGPATIVVRCQSSAELLRLSHSLEGSLTATIHGTVGELAGHGDLVSALSAKAGRLIFNGFPTGVEVGYAMQHGGPYPASTDSRFTSVGAAAIYRFTRPVCYQDFPPHLLPSELQDANPRGIWRTLNGQLSKDPVR